MTCVWAFPAVVKCCEYRHAGAFLSGWAGNDLLQDCRVPVKAVSSCRGKLHLYYCYQRERRRLQSMNIYFCGSIRGGRQDVNIYQRIVKKLQQYGTVLTEHVSSESLSEKGDSLLLSLKVALILILNMYPSSIGWCVNNCKQWHSPNRWLQVISTEHVCLVQVKMRLWMEIKPFMIEIWSGWWSVMVRDHITCSFWYSSLYCCSSGIVIICDPWPYNQS